MEKKERILYFDILNILACFCVIWMHCNGCVHVFTRGGNAWATSLVVETIAYWAVPVFMMISGATLMNYRKKYDTKTFFKKRFLKTVVPFVFWSIAILIWKYTTNKIQIDEISIRKIINILITDKEESTYWFFWALFSVYISMPILSLLTEEKHRKTLWYIVVMAGVLCSIPKLLKFVGIEWNENLNFPVATGYVIYIVLGYLLSTQDIKKKYRILVYLLGIFALFVRYFGTYYLSYKDGVLNRSLWGYTFFTGLFLSVAVFVFFKNIDYSRYIKKEKIATIIGKISSCSFGIYLIHKVVMYYEVRLSGVNTLSWKWRTIGAILTYFVCLCIIYVLKKIPLIRKVVP